jgi:thiamine-monophosphate kinase
MGGTPLTVFLSLALPRHIKQRWVDDFLRGLLTLAKKFSTTLAGGDTAQSPGGILADIIVTGTVPTGTAVLRSGARAEDRIYVTGKLGSAAAEVNQLYSSPAKSRRASRRLPLPRITVGRFLREKRIPTAMIDISDGLSTDLHHICSESRVGAEIWKDAVPRGTLADGKTPVDLRFALHGGDAYELLFTAPNNIKVPGEIDGVPVTEIGHVTLSKRVQLLDGGRREPFKAQGWQHFTA